MRKGDFYTQYAKKNVDFKTLGPGLTKLLFFYIVVEMGFY